MKLFDTQPKSDPRYLYGREKELETLVGYLKEKDWVILLGPRRVGKTSLARCAIAKLGYKSIVIDARENSNFMQSLLTSLKGSKATLGIKAEIKIPHLPLNLGVNYNKVFLKETMEEILGKTKRLFILVDEAQWLRNPRGVVMLLAHIYDYYYDKVTFVITGSTIGVMKSIIEPGAKSPLYGRAVTKMDVKRWGSSVSLGFLKAGTEEANLKLDTKTGILIEENLDGLPGWLTLFGYNYAHMKNSDRALKETIKEAKKIVAQEIESIGELGIGSERLIIVIKALAKGQMRFVDLLQETGFNNTSLSKYLDTLNKLGYIDKDNRGNYTISDPILAHLMLAK